VSGLAGVFAGLVISAIPLGFSVWALLDAAGRPEWAFALAGRSRIAWVALTGAGILFCFLGIVVAPWYLLKVRPRVMAAEAGRLTE
jgi:hypothetical protein